jgi:hypothetical protein
MNLNKGINIIPWFLLFFLNTGFSQNLVKQVNSENQIWTQYSFLGSISEKWSLYFDGVDRFNDFFKSENTIFLRPAIAYNLTKNSSVYAGYCYALSYPTSTINIIVPEHRPWQQLLINQTIGNFSLQHRYRLEERFSEETTPDQLLHKYTFTWRFRYKLNIQYPLWTIQKDRKILSFLFSDEIMVSFGKNVVVSYFNQNRLFGGIAYRFNKNLSVSAGVTNIFRSTSVPGNYININAPTINVNHKIDFRRINKEKDQNK